jgi:hypothetical protein
MAKKTAAQPITPKAAAPATPQKLAPSKAVEAPKAAAKPATKPAVKEMSKVKVLSPEEHYRMVQETAYFRAQADGFQPGKDLQYWLQAEMEVAQRLKK